MKLQANDWLTILRILLIPITLWCFYQQDIAFHKAGIMIFVIAGFTDLLDGQYARFFKTESEFGKMLDPIADKWMALATLIMLIDMKQIPRVMMPIVYVILFREIMVMGLRSISPKLTSIGSSLIGKIKSVTMGFSILFFMIHMVYNNCNACSYSYNYIAHMIAITLLIISSILSLISGLQYTLLACKILSKQK